MGIHKFRKDFVLSLIILDCAPLIQYDYFYFGLLSQWSCLFMSPIIIKMGRFYLRSLHLGLHNCRESLITIYSHYSWNFLSFYSLSHSHVLQLSLNHLFTNIKNKFTYLSTISPHHPHIHLLFPPLFTLNLSTSMLFISFSHIFIVLLKWKERKSKPNEPLSLSLSQKDSTTQTPLPSQPETTRWNPQTLAPTNLPSLSNEPKHSMRIKKEA